MTMTPQQDKDNDVIDSCNNGIDVMQTDLCVGHEFAEGAVFVTPRDEQVVGCLVVLDVLGVELEEWCQVLHDVTDPLC